MAGLYLLKTRSWASRQEARLKLRKQIFVERGLSLDANELPSWVRYPDTARTEWINQVRRFKPFLRL